MGNCETCVTLPGLVDVTFEMAPLAARSNIVYCRVRAGSLNSPNFFFSFSASILVFASGSIHGVPCEKGCTAKMWRSRRWIGISFLGASGMVLTSFWAC